MKIIFLMFTVLFLVPETSFLQPVDPLASDKKYLITLSGEKVSKDFSPSKYKFLASLNSGIVANDYYYGYNSNFIINLRFSYFYNDKINLGGDVSYTSFLDDSHEHDKNSGSGYDEGDQSFIDLLINAQLGTFDKNNVVDLFVNLGAGIHIRDRQSSTITYYSFSHSEYFTERNPTSTRVYPLLQLGGGLIIKPVYNFGINLEVDIEAYEFDFIIPSEAYFPIKAGVSYYFMK